MEQIKEDYVSFEVAKLLKEKGWNILTDTAYDLKTYQPSNGGDEENLKVIKNAKNYGDSTYTRFQRPTQALVIKWLRIKHNIHVWCRKSNNSPKYFYRIDSEKYINYNQNLRFDTPEEATEQAILYCLQNLIK